MIPPRTGTTGFVLLALLLEVEAVGAGGNPLRDLKAGDFVVRLDGEAP